MPRGFQGAVIRMLGVREHLLTVRDTTRLAPHFVRVRFDAAPTFFAHVAPGPASWLRLWVVDPETGGEYQRAYTISGHDADAGWIEIDFLLHEPAGPASAWAAQAAAGQEVVVHSLGSTDYAPVEGATGLLVVGDAASLPAVNGILRAVPHGTRVDVLLERAHDEDERIPVVRHPGASVRWVARGSAGSLAAAAAAHGMPGAQVWAAGETGSLKALRPVLRERFGASRRTAHVQAYWVAGRAMGLARKG